MPPLSKINTRRDVKRYIDTMVTSVDVVSRPIILRWLDDEMTKVLDGPWSHATRRGANAVRQAVRKELNHAR